MDVNKELNVLRKCKNVGVRSGVIGRWGGGGGKGLTEN